MRSSNPTLSERAFQRLREPAVAGTGYAPGNYGPAPYAVTGVADRFTAEGAVTKTGLLLLILIVTGVATVATLPEATILAVLMPAVLVGLGLAIATAIKPAWARVTAPLYAAVEGVVIGGITLFVNRQYPGVAMQAALGTVAVLALMLVLYKTGVIKVTQRFRFGVVAATGAVALVYLANFIAGLFGVSFGFISGNGPMAILISVVVIAIAALNLVLDFDFIVVADREGLPKYAEWYAAFGLIVTLIWLYLELLRLLSKLQSRR